MGGAMKGVLKGMKESRAWHRRFGPFAPQAGDLALDFELCDAAGVNPVRLSDFRGRCPVALVFGSFT
jgi:hypothetical protein